MTSGFRTVLTGSAAGPQSSSSSTIVAAAGDFSCLLMGDEPLTQWRKTFNSKENKKH